MERDMDEKIVLSKQLDYFLLYVYRPHSHASQNALASRVICALAWSAKTRISQQMAIRT